jgi:RNA polymerase sigma-54 factor
MLQQIHYQITRPATTAHLAQTMTLLSLTVEELRQQVETELSSNPALELSTERRCPSCHRLLSPTGPCPVCCQPSKEDSNEPVVFISPREDYYPQGTFESHSDQPVENFTAAQDDLATYVLRQIGPDLKPQQRKLAAYLLTHLDEDGLLPIPLLEVARYYHIPLSDVEDVQRIIQRADPIGVGSCSPQGALLAQLDVLEEIGQIPPLAREIIHKGMDLLSRHQLTELAHMLKAPLRQVQNAYQFICENLNPFPGRSSWGDVRQPAKDGVEVYHRPDILVNFLNDDPQKTLVVEIILPYGGTLQVNPLFRKAIQQAPEENKAEWKGDIERASLFVKCLQQRNHTMQRLIQKLVKLQNEFILYGEKYLKPVTRVQLSRELGVHESTISRAVANKTVQMPNRRIIPLSSFFDRSLNVRTVLCGLISQEKSPLSDSELAELLESQGYKVARRTVAKYRAMEGILPAHLRHSHIKGNCDLALRS